MALNSTIYKVELQISDMDRHYYATHALTLARHPSETEERLMVRLLAFAMHADERLEFGKGISDEDEPALWRKAYTDEIELWIEVGQPDETRIRKACGRSRQVVVISYGGNAAEIWWNKVGSALSRNKNLTVLDIPASTVAGLVALLQRGMRLQCLVQDGQLQLMNDADAVAVDPLRRMEPAETVS
ncbi:YaeQ family protein [Rhodanobacter koreensis]